MVTKLRQTIQNYLTHSCINIKANHTAQTFGSLTLQSRWQLRKCTNFHKPVPRPISSCGFCKKKRSKASLKPNNCPRNYAKQYAQYAETFPPKLGTSIKVASRSPRHNNLSIHETPSFEQRLSVHTPVHDQNLHHSCRRRNARWHLSLA